MIPDFKFLWKQLDGPTATWLSDAIYQYFKAMFKPGIDHLNELSIKNMLFNELLTVGAINSIPYSVVRQDILGSDYFQIYRDASSDGPHVVNSWYNIIQEFPLYNTLAELDADIADIADSNLRGGTVVKVDEDNSYYQVIVTVSDDVPSAQKVLIGVAFTGTLVTVSTPDYTDSRICRYFGSYNAANIADFLDNMGSIIADGDIIQYDDGSSNKYVVYDSGEFKSFASVSAFEDYDDTVYPGGRLISNRQITSGYDFVGIGTEAYRSLLKGLLNSEAEIGSLKSLEDIMAEFIKDDSGEEDVGFRYSFKFKEAPDVDNNMTYGDIVMNIGTQAQWKNITFWRAVLEDIINNIYNYAPKIILKEEQVRVQYTGVIRYNGQYMYS